MMDTLGVRALETRTAMESGFLPGTGGFEDQASFGIRALRVLAFERQAIIETRARAEAEYTEALEKAQRDFGRRHGG